jgi:hypothetical protein
MGAEEEKRRLLELDWQKKLDLYNHSARAAVDLGIAALNAITLLNGGAIVALLAFVGQVWNEGKGAGIVKVLVNSGSPFGWGVAAGGASFFMAYFYQSTVTWRVNLALAALSGPPPAEVRRRAEFTFNLTKILMVLSATAAYLLFLWGVFQVLNAFLRFPSMHT